MKVSIITATYNSEKTVRDTLISVATQTYKNVEHLIVDGNSKDRTLDIVREFPHVSGAVSEKDSGIYDAMNKGIARASGDIIAILNSDDFYANENVIAKVVAAFQNSQAQAIYGDLNYVDADDTSKIIRRWKSGAFKADRFKWGWMPPHPSFFVRKELYQQFGNFNTVLRSAADYELMLRFLYRNHASAQHLPELLVNMRTGGNSNSSLKNRLRANREDRRAWQLNEVKPYFFTLWLKPLRKIPQYF